MSEAILEVNWLVSARFKLTWLVCPLNFGLAAF